MKAAGLVNLYLNHMKALVLTVEAAAESDWWRTTSYGFIHDDGHALVKEFPNESAIEVTFVLNYTEQFDQAGIFITADSENWIKAGVEFCDGFPQVGAVVTQKNSDWSVAPVAEWMKKEVTIPRQSFRRCGYCPSWN